MCKTRLKPRWITILTGVAICALVCVYSTSDSWAAMCMVGYNSSACSGKSSVPVPPTSTGDENGNSNPEIATDCERLGYAERGAKPNSNLWPKIALKNGANNEDKWVCDPCQTGGTLVRDKSGYARYNCYLKCQNEGEATNIEGGTGRINGWGNASYSPNSAISRPSYSAETNAGSARIYRDQFVRTQAECTTIFGTKEVNNKVVPNKKFYWVTRNVCGQCIEQPCDGAEIIPGCYDVCDNKYTLENGTQCCNKLDKLVSLNPAYGDPDYWYPRTSPLYHESGCYNTTTHATAYGDFNNLPDSDVNTYCYHQVKMTCPDYCDEPKEDNDCTCGPKSCETLASEDWAKAKGLTYSANTDNIVENSVIYHFSHGDVEKINNICYQKTLASDCPSSGCYTLSKLQCPNGEPNDDCSCGVGCPYGSIPESEYESNDKYINGKVKTDGEGNPIDYCLELSSDGATCATWSKCYEYNECSDLGDFLVPDGSGGCTCGGTDAEGRTWKTGPGGCDIDNGQPVAEKRFSPPEGNIYKHDMETPVTAIACQTYDGVICQGVLSEGPDDNCECHCTGDYASYYDRGTYKGYSDWTEDDANEPDCTITTNTDTEYGYWTNKAGRKDIEIICHRYEYETVDCPSGTSRNSSCECECSDGWIETDKAAWDGSGEMDEATQYNPNSTNKTSETVSYTNTDGESVTLTCYRYDSINCTKPGEVLTDEGCRSCSDYADEQSSEDCGCGKKVVDTVEHQHQGKTVLTCYKCGIDDPRSCEDAGKMPANATTPYPDNKPLNAGDLWCELKSAGECVAWENGSEIDCQEGKTNQAELAGSTGLCGYDNEGDLRDAGYTQQSSCASGTKTKECYFGCKPWIYCSNIQCPQVPASSCPTGLIKSVACAGETTGFCEKDGNLCFVVEGGELADCRSQSAWEAKGHVF